MRAPHLIMVGETIPGSRTPQRRSAFEEMGFDVTMVSVNRPGMRYETRPALLERIRYRLRLPGDPAAANSALLVAPRPTTQVVWVENARMIKAGTLRSLRRLAPLSKLIWYSEDDTMNPRHRSRWTEACIPLYDLWVTTKSFNAAAAEVPSLGAARVMVVNNSFDPHLHVPVTLSEDDQVRLAADAVFVGTYEGPRATSLLTLAQAGIAVRVWGNGWSHMVGRHKMLTIENRPVYDDDYAKVCSAAKINLAFLRKFNRDLQTCRSVEIPACGAFMLHERNHEIVSLFAEDREAAYFSDDDELVAQCQRWLADDEGRAAIASAGRRRALAGLSHHDILKSVLHSAGVGL